MNIRDLLIYVTDKERFQAVEDYLDFCTRYFDYIENGLQAFIVSQK